MVKKRRSVSFTDANWEKLESEKNVSRTINAALSFYFDSKEYLKTQEYAFILKEMSKYIPRREKYPFKPNRTVFEEDKFDD